MCFCLSLARGPGTGRSTLRHMGTWSSCVESRAGACPRRCFWGALVCVCVCVFPFFFFVCVCVSVCAWLCVVVCGCAWLCVVVCVWLGVCVYIYIYMWFVFVCVVCYVFIYIYICVTGFIWGPPKCPFWTSFKSSFEAPPKKKTLGSAERSIWRAFQGFIWGPPKGSFAAPQNLVL